LIVDEVIFKHKGDWAVFTWIVIEKGEPYPSGTLIKITKSNLIIGRQSQDNLSLDINFTSLFISRKHCCILLDGEKTVFTDIGSKHGAYVNGNIVMPNSPYAVYNKDKIVLARGMVIMQFRQSEGYEETMDFSDTQVEKLNNKLCTIIIDSEKRKCMVNGKVVLLTCKEWSCCALLYKNKNILVTYNELKVAIWSERMSEDENYCNVGNDEINVLLYRLRKKLGTAGNLVKNIRGCGFLLEV